MCVSFFLNVFMLLMLKYQVLWQSEFYFLDKEISWVVEKVMQFKNIAVWELGYVHLAKYANKMRHKHILVLLFDALIFEPHYLWIFCSVSTPLGVIKSVATSKNFWVTVLQMQETIKSCKLQNWVFSWFLFV